jgi:hypothetical protein
MMIDYMGPSLDTTIFAITSGVWLFSEHPATPARRWSRWTGPSRSSPGDRSSTPDASGWYVVGPVTVHFTCSDALSGIPATTCQDDVTFTRNGAGQSVTRTVVDRSGNVGSVTVGGIGIDHERFGRSTPLLRDRAGAARWSTW